MITDMSRIQNVVRNPLYFSLILRIYIEFYKYIGCECLLKKTEFTLFFLQTITQRKGKYNNQNKSNNFS